jgi:hypothetical protein
MSMMIFLIRQGEMSMMLMVGLARARCHRFATEGHVAS